VSFRQTVSKEVSSTMSKPLLDVVYYESIKRELKRRLKYEYRYDERLKTKNEESTRLVDTGLVVCLLIIMNQLEFIIKSIKREVKTRPIYDCRCDERLESKDDESTCLAYMGCSIICCVFICSRIKKGEDQICCLFFVFHFFFKKKNSWKMNKESGRTIIPVHVALQGPPCFSDTHHTHTHTYTQELIDTHTFRWTNSSHGVRERWKLIAAAQTMKDAQDKGARDEADAGARDESAGCRAKGVTQAMSSQASVILVFCLRLRVNRMC
jgi:hypothetical protein